MGFRKNRPNSQDESTPVVTSLAKVVEAVKEDLEPKYGLKSLSEVNSEESDTLQEKDDTIDDEE